MDWFIYDRGLRHERVKWSWLVDCRGRTVGERWWSLTTTTHILNKIEKCVTVKSGFEEKVYNSRTNLTCLENCWLIKLLITVWKVSKYWVFFGPYFPVFGLNTEIYGVNLFSPNTGKDGPEKNPYLETFHVVMCESNNEDSPAHYQVTRIFPT